MGMTIDDSERCLRLMLGGMKYAVRYWEDRDKEESDIEQTNVEAVETALDTMSKYQQLQAEYETRLKTDIVAVLVELKEQLREMHEDFFETEHFDEAYGVSDSMDVIQQKIDALRGEK